MTFTEDFLAETVRSVRRLDTEQIEGIATGLAAVRERDGRLFILGVGGSAGHASHAVNDFRKICGIEAYAPTDNVSELTARINDEGWETTFAAWLARLAARRRRRRAGVLGRRRQRREERLGQHRPRPSSSPRSVGAAIFGIVGRDGGTPPSSPTPA